MNQAYIYFGYFVGYLNEKLEVVVNSLNRHMLISVYVFTWKMEWIQSAGMVCLIEFKCKFRIMIESFHLGFSGKDMPIEWRRTAVIFFQSEQ